MPKPSLLQTILRQPSQSYSYSSSRDDASSDRATTNSYFSTKGKGKERASSIRSGVSSVSSYSQKSDYVSPLPRGNGGGGWEWATFGARKGLTGGPGSLRAPSDIVRASTDARGGDDERSLRSTRSLNSVRSAGTASGSLLGGWIPPPERERIARERERALEKEREREERASRRYSDMPLSSGLVVQTELEEGVTSRRYSSAIPSTSSNAVYDPRYQHPRSHTLQHATSSPQLSSSPELSTQQPKPRTKKKSSRSKLSSSTTTSPLVSSSPSLSSVTSSPTQQHHRRLNSLSQEGSSSTPTPSLTSSVSSAPSSSSVPRTPISTKIPEPAVFLREPDPYEIHSLENSDYVTVAPSVEKVQEKVKRKKTKKVVKKEADGGSSESGLVDEVRPRVSTIPEPTILLPFPSTEPVPTTVPLPDPSTFPAPSAAFDDSPVVGAVYTMDELFDSLCAAVAPAEEGEPGGAIPSQPEQDMPLTRMEHEGASPSVPEERESDNIDIKEQVSTVAPLSLAQEMSPPTPTPPSDSQPQQPKNETTTAAIPRISLTRTESDQAKTGVQGDVDVEPPTSPQPTSGSPPRPSLTRKSSKRRSSISKTAAPPVIEAQKAVYQVVASSTTGGEKRRKSTTPSSLSSAKPLTSANLAAADKAASTSPVNQSRSLSVSVSGTTAAQDAPQWLKNIRALGEPIQTSLVTSSAPASVRRSKSLSMSSPPSFSRLEVPSPQPQLETDSTYEPPRVHYHPAVVPPVDPTFSAPTLDTLGLSFPPSASELDHDNFLPSTFPPRSRAVSVFSNTTSIGGQSISGLTTMSVPIGAYQPSKNPKRVSTILASSSSSMTALHVSANALECGYDVSKIKRGDFVYGLQTLKKSGALAELMTVDRTLLTLAPSCGMSVEEIAALPHSGILASQIMETVCQELPKGSKILILNAHEGVGNLCMQLGFYYRTTRDMWVVAQCPLTVVDGDAYCRATGASDVIRDEPLATMNAIHESSFDVVIDTIGGRRLYDAARRILHFDGQFITTVGDSLSAATPTTQWKTSIRSLRRAFFPKDKKNVGYWAVNLDERELPRDALDKLRDAVELSGVRPAVRRVVAFDEAAKAFDEEMGSGRVVKIVEV
ncbi:hypothetical protein T439DRAFT_200504 [Meredithblackwellia eburnea MCA 4105]